jgi:hypothetical protein
MAEVSIPGLSTQLTSVDRAADLLEVSDTSDAGNSKKSSVNNLLDLTTHPVGVDDVQTLTNKTITAPTISSPVLSGTVTGTYTLGGIPTFPSAVVTLTGSQTLTNKVLTSPTITNATVVNPTITVDTVSEYTGANGVTIDGLNIKDGKLNTNNSVVTANITDAAVTFDKTSGIWWEELGRTTLGSAGNSIVVNFSARKYLMILAQLSATGGTITGLTRFNNDAGSNYSRRVSDNGAADVTNTSGSGIEISAGGAAAPFQAHGYISNIQTLEKIYTGWATGATPGAGNAPFRSERTGKWANTSNQITMIDVQNAGTGQFAIGSEVIVLGHD